MRNGPGTVCGATCGCKPNRAFSSSLHGCPPELELSTSETPLSAGLGGRDPKWYLHKKTQNQIEKRRRKKQKQNKNTLKWRKWYTLYLDQI